MARAESSFIYYYQTELAYYRELAQEFGRVHPEVAHLVAERGGDTAADRLFQGAALLTARLRQRVEDDFPEVAHPLFDQLWPQFLRPLPAVTLLRFTPLPNALRQSQPIPRGTVVRSRAVTGMEGERAECPFSTCASVNLHPLELEEVSLDRPRAGDLQLRLRFSVTGGARLGALTLPGLRLQLLGDPRTKLTLYAWLALKTQAVSLRDPAGETRLRLPRTAIRPVGLEPEEALCPVQPTPLPGLHLLQEYFVFPDKFLGVEILGLDRLPEDIDLDLFDLVFHLGSMEEPEIRPQVANLSTSCVPAVNLSDRHRLDIRVAPGEHRFRLPTPHPGAEVFAVEQVRAFDQQRGDWVDYLHFHGELLEADRSCYLVTRRSDVVEGVETFIDVLDSDGHPLSPSTDVLQVWCTYTNGPLAVRLGEGQVDQPSPSSPEFATFTNVAPVTPGLPVGLGRERFWRLLAQLNMHPAELCSQGIELLVDDSEGGRSGGGGPEIIEVRASTSSRLFRRTVVPMQQVQVVLSDTSFLCEGQMFLFASVLDRLFARPPGSTTFVQLTVQGSPSGTTYRFAPT